MASNILRVGEGVNMEWDGPNMRATNDPNAEKYVRPQRRKGWEV